MCLWDILWRKVKFLWFLDCESHDNNIKKQIESTVNEALKAREEERGKAKWKN